MTDVDSGDELADDGAGSAVADDFALPDAPFASPEEHLGKVVDELHDTFGDFDEEGVLAAIDRRVDLGEFADAPAALTELRRLAEASATATAERSRPAKTYEEAIARHLPRVEELERELDKAEQQARDKAGRFKAS